MCVMKNIIHVLYPDDKTFGYVIVTNNKVTVETLLEQVFAEWNHGSGKECDLFKSGKTRSLSVNDIVCINGNYYQCKSSGWRNVTPSYVTSLEQKVNSHPFRLTNSPWYVLNLIMQN